MANKKRVEFRKNRTKPPRANDLTKAFGDGTSDDAASGERVRAKGDLSRHRTVTESAPGDDLLPGRVIRVHGLFSVVELADGREVRCTVRRILKTMATDERGAVTTGDLVRIRVGSGQRAEGSENQEGGSGVALPSALCPLPANGVIEHVEPRRGVLTRASRRREHVLVANVDQLAVVMSLVEPDLKPHLIDRYLAAAMKGDLAPILLLNKADLADPVELQPLVGAFSQLGVPTVLTSAKTGLGLGRLRALLAGRSTVFSGQSGVGKSSLLNAVEPDLGLRVRAVSEVNSKGRHTTTTAELIKLTSGGWVVDTPGVRQLQLWDMSKEEAEGYFPEFRPFVPLCRFPDCTHTHEGGCAVKAAVGRRQVSDRRYVSYLGLFRGADEE